MIAMTTKLAKAKIRAGAMQRSQRQMRARMRLLQNHYDAVLAALIALIEEPQPLGIDRPVYQCALAAVLAAEAVR